MDYQIIVQQANKHIEQAVAYFSNRDNANKAKKFVALSVAAYIITKVKKKKNTRDKKSTS